MTSTSTSTAAGRTRGETVVRVRYFAAAAEAAGTPAEDLHLPAGSTGAELLAAIRAARGPDVERVLAISSLLVDGVVTEDLAAPLTTGEATSVHVDVLPPFAGG